MIRSCDSCKACCTLTRVFELSKPEGQACAHICEAGCSIYESRPPSCAGFICCWLAGDMPDEMRPDLSGVLVEHLPLGIRTVLILTEAEDTPIPQEVVDYYTSQGRAIAARGQRVFLSEGMTHNDVRVDLHRASIYLGV